MQYRAITQRHLGGRGGSCPGAAHRAAWGEEGGVPHAVTEVGGQKGEGWDARVDPGMSHGGTVGLSWPTPAPVV